MHKVLNNNSPNYLAQIFVSHRSHCANSRNNLYVPRPRLDLFKTSISFAGAFLWNSLPQNIKPYISLPCFKRNLYKCLRITSRQIWTHLFESHVCLNFLVLYTCVGERCGERGKQVGSMNEESQVRGCYNITFICTNQETDESDA